MKTIAIFVALTVIATSAGAADATICPGRNSSQTPTTQTARFDVGNVADGVVTDKATKLKWKRCEIGWEWDGANQCVYSGTPDYAWTDALKLVSLRTDGWRMPNIKELTSIIEYSCANPALNNKLFPDGYSHFIWSSSASKDGLVWGVNFYTGAVEQISAANKAYLRLVHD